MRNSYEWINAILSKLFAAEERRFDRMIENLNQKNSELKNKQLYGFMHMGVLRIPEKYQNQFKRQAMIRGSREPTPTLHLSLSEEAGQMHRDMEKVLLDKDQINQMLFILLKDTTSLQEIRDRLPDCVIGLAPPPLPSMTRQGPSPEHYLESNPKGLAMYLKLLPKIEMYSMSLLLY